MTIGTERTTTTPSQTRETPNLFRAPERDFDRDPTHDPVSSQIHALVSAGGASGSSLQAARIFRSPEFSQPVNDSQKARVLRSLQRSHGNQSVQRMVNRSVPPGIQPKLEISSPGDALEREADTIANQVMNMSSPNSAAPAQLSRHPLPISRAPEGVASRTASPEFERNLNAQRGSGQPLSRSSREFFEPRMGHDLSGVRVHQGGEAAAAAQEINAQAFTHGRDIYFNEGKYQPETTSGRRLLAHELAHTVQQTGGTQRSILAQTPNLIQRTNNPTSGSPHPSITLASLDIPEFKMRDTSTFNRSTLFTSHPGQYFRAASYLRDPSSTQQVSVWEDRVNPSTIESKLRAAPFNMQDNHTYMIRARGGERSTDRIGGPRELAYGLKRPFWKPGTVELENYEVDHVVELQTAGFPRESWADDISNYQLLNQGANSRSGQIIRQQITNAINRYRGNPPAGSPLPTPAPPTDTIKQTYDVHFQAFNSNSGLNPGVNITYWDLNQIRAGRHIDDLASKNRDQRPIYLLNMSDPVPAGNFYSNLPSAEDVASLTGASSRFVIYMGSAGGNRKSVFGWPSTNPSQDVSRSVSASDILIKGGFETREVAFNRSGSGPWGGVLRGEVFHHQSQLAGATDRTYPWHVRRVPGTAFAGYLDYGEMLGFLRDRMTFHGLSPIHIDDVSVDDEKGLIAAGKISCTLPLLQGVEIDLVFEGNDLRAEKVFDLGDFKVPRPLEVRSSSMVLSIGTRSGLRARGRVDFAIPNAAEGYLEGGVGTGTGLYLAGGLRFDRDTFSGEVDLRYQNSEFSGQGVIRVPSGKITGIRGATLNVNYEHGDFRAAGTADFTIQGISQARLGFAQTEAEGTVITASVELGSLPGIQSGAISARVAKPPGTTEWQLSGNGTAVPAIPGVDSSLRVSIDRGIFTAEARASYRRGMLSGTLEVGATNRPINPEGRPVEGGQPAPTITPYGQGQLTVRIAPWLQGTIGVRILPNGEIEVSGAIGLPSSLNLFPAKPFNKNIFHIDIDIPIVGVSVLGHRIGIFATIGGGLDVDAGIGPGQLRELGLGITYNPAHEDQAHVTGRAQLFIPAHAGLRLFVRGGLGVGIPIVSATARLVVGASLGLEGAVVASVDVDWMPQRGLILNARGEIYAQPKFRFDVTGEVLVEADLLFKTIELYKKTWNLASFEWGSDLRFGIRFPIHYEEGREFDISLHDVEFVVPQINPMDLLTGLVKRIA